MKLEAGIFIRTPLGIDKIINLRLQDEYGCNYDTQLEHNLFLNNERDYISIDGECFGKEEIKASHNLLGNDKEPCLIEVGDYVNCEKVIRIDKDPFIKGQINLWTNTTTSNYWGDISLSPIIEKDIKSIVTKEQFEVMQYKVGE